MIGRPVALMNPQETGPRRAANLIVSAMDRTSEMTVGVRQLVLLLRHQSLFKILLHFPLSIFLPE